MKSLTSRIYRGENGSYIFHYFFCFHRERANQGSVTLEYITIMSLCDVLTTHTQMHTQYIYILMKTDIEE